MYDTTEGSWDRTESVGITVLAFPSAISSTAASAVEADESENATGAVAWAADRHMSSDSGIGLGITGLRSSDTWIEGTMNADVLRGLAVALPSTGLIPTADMSVREPVGVVVELSDLIENERRKQKLL